MSSKQISLAIIDTIGAKAGMDEYNRRLAHALACADVPTTVFGTFSAPPRHEKYFSDKFIRGPLGYLKHRIERYRALRALSQRSFSHVLIHIFRMDDSALRLLRSVRRMGCKPILLWHDIEPLVQRPSAVPKLRLEADDILLVHNSFSAEELRTRLPQGFPVHIIPHGHFIPSGNTSIDRQQARQKLGVPSDAFCPLFFGMLKQSKGLDVLIHAFKDLPVSFHLLVAGRRRDVDVSMLRQLEQLKNDSRCTLHIGYLPVKEMEYWFAASDVVVIPYRRIYQSGVAIQAISRCKPVVLSDIRPHQDWLAEGLPALLFKDGQPEDLRRVLLEMASSHEQNRERADKALSYLRTHHDWSLVAEKIKSLIAV